MFANHSPLATSHDFLLLRYNRDVIKEAPIRMNHLLQMPRGERTCPLQEVLYRRAGLRIVGKHGMSEGNSVSGDR